jgi:hypothetical protein
LLLTVDVGERWKGTRLPSWTLLHGILNGTAPFGYGRVGDVRWFSLAVGYEFAESMLTWFRFGDVSDLTTQVLDREHGRCGCAEDDIELR